MKKKIFLGLSTLALLFNGCATKNLEDLQIKETYNSKVIKSVVDENISGASAGTTSLLNINNKKETSPLLAPPKVAKMKVESYIDSDGDYHEIQKIHIKIEAARFVDNPKMFTINENEKGIF